jgi:hypothetical protein
MTKSLDQFNTRPSVPEFRNDFYTRRQKKLVAHPLYLSLFGHAERWLMKRSTNPLNMDIIPNASEGPAFRT